MELVSLVRPEHGNTPMRRLRRRWYKSVIGSEHHGLYFTSNLFQKSNANVATISCSRVRSNYLSPTSTYCTSAIIGVAIIDPLNRVVGTACIITEDWSRRPELNWHPRLEGTLASPLAYGVKKCWRSRPDSNRHLLDRQSRAFAH